MMLTRALARRYQKPFLLLALIAVCPLVVRGEPSSTRPPTKGRPRIGLVLSGGDARGTAHRAPPLSSLASAIKERA